MSEIENQFRYDTLNDCFDLLQLLRFELDQVAAGSNFPSHAATIFRYLHSLKGNAQAAAFGPLAAFLHDVEDLVFKLKEQHLVFDANTLGVLGFIFAHIECALELLRQDLSAAYDFSSAEMLVKGSLKKSANSHCILVVDDEPDMIEILSEFVQRAAPAFILTASNGKSALSLAQRIRFDLILTDYKMPIMNGEEFLREIRESEAINLMTPVLFVSGLKPDHAADDQLWDKVFFLGKPLTFNKLKYYLSCAQKIAKVS